jgi:hypothetical protein
MTENYGQRPDPSSKFVSPATSNLSQFDFISEKHFEPRCSGHFKKEEAPWWWSMKLQTACLFKKILFEFSVKDVLVEIRDAFVGAGARFSKI